MKTFSIILPLLIFSSPILAFNSAHDSRILAFGGISLTFLCIFLYLVYDYSGMIAKKDNAGNPNESSISEFYNTDGEKNFNFRTIIRKAMYASARKELETAPLGAEFIVVPQTGSPLQVQKNGSVMVLSRPSAVPNKEILDPLKNAMIVKNESGVYLPVAIPGMVSWLFIPGKLDDNNMSLFWDIANRLALEFAATVRNEQDNLDINTGLFNRNKLEQDLASRTEQSTYLVFAQIHGSDETALVVIEELQKSIRDLYLVSDHTIAFFQNKKTLTSLEGTVSEIILQLKKEGHHVSLSIGSCERKTRDAENWFMDTQKALRTACIKGPDYFYQI